jgi:ABC-type nickel/cobalt efflux system permease component RcnA
MVYPSLKPLRIQIESIQPKCHNTHTHTHTHTHAHAHAHAHTHTRTSGYRELETLEFFTLM